MERPPDRPLERRASLRSAVVWEACRERLGEGEPRRVVDIGGGTGGLAVRIAGLGHEVVVVDPNPDALAARIRNAGAIFLGRYTPEAIGDYVAGPNHVLPTARSARFSSGLNVLDFMKRTTFVACDADSLKAIGPAAVTLAMAEGLEAHARSVAQRLPGYKD